MMIQLAANRASLLSRTSSPCQRRFKSFVRRVDKNNEVYYTLAKNGLARNPDPNREYKFFEMPDLLLDLDADGTRHVRSFEDVDEQLMKRKWAEVPKRTEIKARLKEFENQVYVSRQKARDILSQPTNIWRITPHDIISTALYGAPNGQRESPPTLIPKSTDQTSQSMPLLYHGPVRTDKLRCENGIPPHAASEDQLLMHWMTLRRKSLEHAFKTRKQHAPTHAQLVEALNSQESISGVRRLVFQCLAAGTNITSQQDGTRFSAHLSERIRHACERIMGQHPDSRKLRLEVLTFLANLSQRLGKLDTHLGLHLCGLALRLSAQVGSLEAISGWLYRSHQTNQPPPGLSDDLFMDDVLSSLTSLLSTLRNEGNTVALQAVEQRQLLLQLLTGIDENDAVASDSFRVLVSAFSGGHGSNLARDAYTTYITLLGELGAARTIWKEWRELLASRYNTTFHVDDDLAFIFGGALKQALGVMSTSDFEQIGLDASLTTCVTMDYHAIETQDSSTWRTASVNTTAQRLRIDAATCQSTLALPLEACIKKVGTW